MKKDIYDKISEELTKGEYLSPIELRENLSVEDEEYSLGEVREALDELASAGEVDRRLSDESVRMEYSVAT